MMTHTPHTPNMPYGEPTSDPASEPIAGKAGTGGDRGSAGSAPAFDSPLRRTTLDSLVDAASRAQQAQRGRAVRPAAAGTVVGLVCVLAIGLAIWGSIMGLPEELVLGMAMVFVGVTIGWTLMSFIMDDRLHPEVHTSRSTFVLTACSIGLTLFGVLVMFSLFSSIGVLLIGALAGLVMLVTVGLIVAPWWISLVSDLGMQRARTAREELRADIASRLHDSVLQTLALIQLQANDPKKVAALARSQERDLREWLYGDPEAVAHSRQPGGAGLAEDREESGGLRSAGVNVAESRPAASQSGVSQSVDPRPAASQSAASRTAAPSSASVGGQTAEPFSRVLKRVAAQVEDSYEQPIEVVTVGECPYRPDFASLLDAAAESMTNAAKHGAPPIAVYMEVSGGRLQVFVRDHGGGFDANRLPAGHLGVRESILGRMKRAGGTAQIVSRPGWGTEVRLTQPMGD
ncbi:sensor histidine kinase [Bifidobacterium simiarum]|uniref:ATP-binding protein n=1 Tax=Bifidobacterium simiarum TaxID=2045441 RepID=A0A2M9HG48_9BIFI|nr:ATP-binding protein [Bifidobacterium simiarum]PJM75794.1 ATP-binding protein [Bifidobacterium simiarum]